MKVYVKTDDNNRITNVSSSAFIAVPADWTEIDEGSGDRYMHAQAHYFPLPIIDGNGVCRYKLADGVPVERTPEEMAEDMPEPSEPGMTLEEQVQMLTDCVLEMSEILYA